MGPVGAEAIKPMMKPLYASSNVVTGSIPNIISKYKVATFLRDTEKVSFFILNKSVRTVCKYE